MSRLQVPVATDPAQLERQLNNPTTEAVRARALEVFGDEAKAQSWMTSQRTIFDGKSPEQLISTGDATQLRRVLETLIRIDCGVFS